MSDIDLVPAPRFSRRFEGTLDLSSLSHIAAEVGFEAAGALSALWLGRALGRAVDCVPISGKDAAGTFVAIEIDPSIASASTAVAIGAESYELDTREGKAVIRASGTEGALRGASTLAQLTHAYGKSVPAILVRDGPRFSWRGVMLDSVRNFQRVEFIEKFLDLMALHKLNRFHWHLTDDQGWRLDIPSMPEVARLGSRRLDRRLNIPRWKEGFYSRDDVRRVVDFAGERGIVVVPEIETPGHSVALLASHPELSCRGGAEDGAPFFPEDRNGVFQEVLCAGNEAVFDFLAKVFDEVGLLFPGPWVHAGGDEVPKSRWSECPKCRRVMKAHNLRDSGGALEPELLQGWFMDRVAALLAERGKRMVGWDEMLEGRPRQDAIVMSWRGYEGGIEAARRGHDVVMSPQTRACYLDHKHLDIPEEPGQLGTCTVRDSYAFEPVPAALDPEQVDRILGGQANIWTELMYFGRQIEYMAFPRLSALAEVFWSPKESRNWNDFVRRLPALGRMLDALDVNRYRGALERPSDDGAPNRDAATEGPRAPTPVRAS